MKSAIEIAGELDTTMPSIGFFSKQKRIYAFAWALSRAQELADDDTELAVDALEILARISKPFHKALGMTALNITNAGMIGLLDECGWRMANILAFHSGLPYRMLEGFKA